MATTVAQWQLTTFTTPSASASLSSSVVKGNFNTVLTAYNSHDADPGIHLQSSVLASRPAAATAGRKWMTSDGLKIYYDTGSVWSEIAYLPSVGGTVSGNVIVSSGGITVTGNSTITGTLSGITTLTATTFSGALSGNATTASAWQTARTIWGQSIDGSGNITGALTIATGGLAVNAGTSIFSAAVTVNSTITIGAGGALTLTVGGGAAAATGAIRLENSQVIRARNAANNADIDVIYADSSNRVFVGSTSFPTFVSGSQLGFFSTVPISKPTVSGAKSSNAALASLMTALSTLGLVTDSTSA